MKTLAVMIKVKREKIETAKRFLRAFVQPSRSEPGCIQYDLFQCPDDPQIFFFFEKWKDEEAFKAHELQSFLREFRERHEELLEQPNDRLWLTPVE